MQNGTCNLPYRCWVEVEPVLSCLKIFWILSKETQESFNFQTFHSTTVHLYIKIFHTKNGKGHILTLMSDNLPYFNCLSYEMVQHKLNQELTNKQNFEVYNWHETFY